MTFHKMKTKLIMAALAALFWVAIGTLLAGAGGSHPDFPNNGHDSPRFYASPHLHPQHP